MQDKCDDQLKNGCPFKDKLNEYFRKYRIGLCASRHDYTKEEFNIRYCTLMDLEKCVANAYTDLIYKGSTPDFISVWKNYLSKEPKNEHITPSSNDTTLSKIKLIIDNWAVDDDEHELLEQIADIIGGGNE